MEAQTREINGHTYTVTPLPARRAFKLKTRLVRALGPGLAAMVGSAKGASLMDSEVDGAALASGVETLFANLGSDEDILQLLMELLQGARRDNIEITPATFDLDFQGCLSDAYQIAWFVVEVNFRDFFGGASIGNLGEAIRSRIAGSVGASGKA